MNFISNLRSIFSRNIPLVNEEGIELTKADISRNTINLLRGYRKSINEERENLFSDLEQFKEDLNEFSKSNDGLKNILKQQIERQEKLFKSDLGDNNKKREEAEQELLKAIENHLRELTPFETDFAYKKYIDGSMKRKRETMPQVDSKDIDNVVLHFAQKSPNAKVTKESINISDVNLVQGEINEKKVKDILRNPESMNGNFLFAKEKGKYYLIDGNHRFCALCEINEEAKVEGHVIHLPVKEAVRRLNLMNVTYNDAISKAEKAFDTIEEAYREDFIEPSLFFEYKKKLSQFKTEFQKGTVKDRYAACIVMNENSKILFLRRDPNDDFEPYTLCLPSGSVEFGESEEEAAVRELEEETSLKATNIMPAVKIDLDNTCICYFFVQTEGKEIILDKESSNYEWHSLEEIKRDENLKGQLILDLFDHLQEALEPVEFGMRVVRKAFDEGEIEIEEYQKAVDLYKAKSKKRGKKEKKKNKKDNKACWDGYEMFGMKKKNGRTVPNCIPVKKSKEDIEKSLNTFEEFYDKGFIEEADILFLRKNAGKKLESNRISSIIQKALDREEFMTKKDEMILEMKEKIRGEMKKSIDIDFLPPDDLGRNRVRLSKVFNDVKDDSIIRAKRVQDLIIDKYKSYLEINEMINAQ